MTVAGQEAVNYSYDSNSRLTQILTDLSVIASGAKQSLSFAFNYDELGRRISTILPNGVTTNYSYDNASHLLELKHLNPLNQILESLNYVYDANGNRTKMDRQNVSVKLPNAVTNTTYNQANQMLTFNDKSITYDANGNMTSVTNACGITNYTWDVRNRLAGISGFNTDCAPLTASFKYDALGRRIEKTINSKTINYLYDGLDIVQEIENGTVTVNYVRTLNIDEPLARIKTDGTIRFYQQDALGSVIALTDETGVIKTQYSYDPFGAVIITGEASDNPFQFAGRENDGTGLLFERNRYLSFELQRYISQDPIGFAGGDVNFYSRVGNNPVNWIDPLGLDAELCTRSFYPSFWMPAEHCYIRFNGNKADTRSFDSKGVHPDKAPTWWPGQSCSPTKGKQDDECVKKEMNKCKADQYNFTGFNCCHCAENALKACGQSSSTGWPNWPINPGPQPGEPGYKL